MNIQIWLFHSSCVLWNTNWYRYLHDNRLRRLLRFIPLESFRSLLLESDQMPKQYKPETTASCPVLALKTLSETSLVISTDLFCASSYKAIDRWCSNLKPGIQKVGTMQVCENIGMQVCENNGKFCEWFHSERWCQVRRSSERDSTITLLIDSIGGRAHCLGLNSQFSVTTASDSVYRAICSCHSRNSLFRITISAGTRRSGNRRAAAAGKSPRYFQFRPSLRWYHRSTNTIALAKFQKRPFRFEQNPEQTKWFSILENQWFSFSLRIWELEVIRMLPPLQLKGFIVLYLYFMWQPCIRTG